MPHETFLPRVREILSKSGILLIADEVITAFGRTGAWTGSRLWNVQPDMMCTAKGITNGFFPFGATLIGHEIAAAFESNQDTLAEVNHGYTYSGHPVGAAAALATLKELETNDVAANAAARGPELARGLAEIKDKHPSVGDVRGIGLMHALELVEDRETKKPLARAKMAQVFEAIYAQDVMVRVSGNLIILSPPLIVSAEHIQRIIQAVDAGLGV